MPLSHSISVSFCYCLSVCLPVAVCLSASLSLSVCLVTVCHSIPLFVSVSVSAVPYAAWLHTSGDTNGHFVPAGATYQECSETSQSPELQTTAEDAAWWRWPWVWHWTRTSQVNLVWPFIVCCTSLSKNLLQLNTQCKKSFLCISTHGW